MAAGTEQRMAADMATEAAADSDPTSTEEEQPSYEAGHMDVDLFDDGYLLERLIGSVRLTDDRTQWMIASVWSVLDGSGMGLKSESAVAVESEPGREESAATRSATQPLVTTESLAW
jgi:hypothetical protein